MDWIASYHALTGGIVTLTGGSDKLVHVHVGMMIYVGAQIALRTRRASGLALQIALALELANETMDRVFWGEWRWPDTIGDVAATMFWPCTLYAVSRYRRARWQRTIASRTVESRGALATASSGSY